MAFKRSFRKSRRRSFGHRSVRRSRTRTLRSYGSSRGGIRL